MAFCMDIHVSIPLFLIPEFYSGDLSVAFLEDGGGGHLYFLASGLICGPSHLSILHTCNSPPLQAASLLNLAIVAEK